MRYGSVCSGVEAASLAWMPLGWECAFVAEVEPFPCAVLMQKFGATLRGNMGTGGNTVPLVQKAVAISANIIGRKPENGGHQLGVGGDVAFTQDTCCVMGVSYRQTVRRLTPVECERLMGFPDNHTLLFMWKGKGVSGKCPDGPRYKACGNSMCVNCMEWIGRQIQNEMEKP